MRLAFCESCNIHLLLLEYVDWIRRLDLYTRDLAHGIFQSTRISIDSECRLQAAVTESHGFNAGELTWNSGLISGVLIRVHGSLLFS